MIHTYIKFSKARAVPHPKKWRFKFLKRRRKNSPHFIRRDIAFFPLENLVEQGLKSSALAEPLQNLHFSKIVRFAQNNIANFP